MCYYKKETGVAANDRDYVYYHPGTNKIFLYAKPIDKPDNEWSSIFDFQKLENTEDHYKITLRMTLQDGTNNDRIITKDFDCDSNEEYGIGTT